MVLCVCANDCVTSLWFVSGGLRFWCGVFLRFPYVTCVRCRWNIRNLTINTWIRCKTSDIYYKYDANDILYFIGRFCYITCHVRCGFIWKDLMLMTPMTSWVSSIYFDGKRSEWNQMKQTTEGRTTKLSYKRFSC